MKSNILLRTILVIFILMGQGCDFVYKHLDKEGAQEKELVGQLVPFEKNPRVEEIQSLLKIYGYNPGAVDGGLGAKTREAIIRFQEENALKVTRYVDTDTWNKLNVFKENQLIVNNELNRKLIQQILQKAGCDPGPADGRWGRKTDNAIKIFQQTHGLKADGRVGYKTLQKLSAYLKSN